MKRLLTYAILFVGPIAIAIGLWKAHEEGFDALAHLPTADSTLASVDFIALRNAGMLKVLAAKPEVEEPEYLSFIRSTGFDYQKDLDRVTAAFTADATYFLVKGRFDWPKLESFAKANGGGCYERLCHLPGSQPSREISFLPLATNMMALAVTTDMLAAARLRDAKSSTLSAPKDPIWISIPSGAFQRVSTLSPALRLFTATVTGANRVTLTANLTAARLEVLCNTPQTAQTITAQLTKVSSELKGVMLTGSFQQANQKVFGYWPIPKTFLENLAAGI